MTAEPGSDGATLKQLRKAKKLSVPRAARKFEVSERTWQRWEKAQIVPPAVLELLSKVEIDG